MTEPVKLSSYESAGVYDFGVQIFASGDKQVLQDELVKEATWAALKLIQDAIIEAQVRHDPVAQQHAAKERADLLGLFEGQAIFVEEVPNGYATDAYHKHRPWFMVTTKIGRITVGWRKRVISIDWSQCPGTESASAIFPEENTTKIAYCIHAWDLAAARRYLQTLLGSKND